MTNFITVMEYLLILFGGGLMGYQFLLSLFAFGAKDIKNFETERKRKFAVVIPAHNEEEVISKTLYSLFGMVYPKNLYESVVVADNCTDHTADIARKMGAIVLQRTNDQEQGKGYALRWAFDQILKWDDDFDAVIVLDSDSLISGNFLEVMNYYLEKGSQVIQSSDLVIPQPGAWASEVIRIGFLLYNFVKPLGRSMLHLNMGLRGNGMCFSAEVLKKYPWQACSLTEDLEYGLVLLLVGVRIAFAPEANIWAQMPGKAENAESQQTRCEIGRYPIIRKYAPKFLNRFFNTGSFRFLDTFIDLITPPLANLFFFVLLMLIFNIALFLLGWIPTVFVWIWCGIVLMGGLHLLLGMLAVGADKQMYKSVLYIPWYVFWKLRVYVTKFIGGRDNHRIRTPRDLNGIKNK